MSPEATLATGLAGLFDLEGVQGTFLVTGGGLLAARMVSELVDDATLTEVGGRIIRLAETLAAVGLDPETCVLRFSEHKVHVKLLPGGALCIVTASEVNMPALRMAANLVARKVAPELVRLGITSTRAASTGAAPPPVPRTPPTSTSPARRSSASMPVVASEPAEAAPRMYRGRPIG